MLNSTISLAGLSLCLATLTHDARAQSQIALQEQLWRVPIHSAPDDPVGGAYGTWAAGQTFKASFHDGFRFYPVLGKSYPRNLPLGWRTESVRVGTTSLLELANGQVNPPTSHATAWRHEYRWPGFTEAYDVRAEGVEQTFVIAERPGVAGDLVVLGGVTTELVAQANEARHGELLFCDQEGRSLVSYGAAFAIDAAGERIPIATAYDGSRIALTVPEQFVARASFPLTIDPLLARVTVDTWGAPSFGLLVSTSVARDDEATTRNVMTFWARNVSLTDYDAYAVLTDDDFSNGVTVFTDVTTSWSTVDGDATFVGGADRFVLALQRDFASNSGVRCYLHDSGNSTLNSGTLLGISIPAGETNRNPSIGGVPGFGTGTYALIVYTADITVAQTNTANTEVWALRVNAATANLGSRFLLAPGNTSGGRNLDREYPDVTQYAGPNADDSWISLWQELNNAVSGQSWEVKGVRIRQDGTIGGPVSGFIGGAGMPHHIRPKVDGQGGRYMATYLRTDTLNQGFAKQLQTYRFDWPDGASSTSIVYRDYRFLATNASNVLVQGGIAYDDNTDSHWAIVYQQNGLPNSSLFVRRVGFTGGVTEAATLHAPTSGDGAHMGSVTFDNDANAFQIVYNTLGAGSPLYGRLLTYPSNAISVLYGTGCGGTISSGDPFAGSEFFYVALSGAAPSQNAALFLGVGSAAISLTPVGMPSCFLNVNPIVATLPIVTGVTGGASFTLALPDAPVALGNVYTQWLHADPAAPWALKLRTTQGLRVQIH